MSWLDKFRKSSRPAPTPPPPPVPSGTPAVGPSSDGNGTGVPQPSAARIGPEMVGERTFVDTLADRAEQLADHARTHGTSPTLIQEIKSIQQQLKRKERAGRARARVRAAADVIFQVREREFDSGVREAERLIADLARHRTDKHPGDVVKQTRARFRGLMMPKQERDRLRGELDRVADTLFNKYRTHRDKEHDLRRRERIRRLEDVLHRKDEQLRRTEDRIRRMKEAEDRLDRTRRDYAQRLREQFGLYGKTPLRRNSRQRELEARVVGLESKVADIRKSIREAQEKRDDLSRQIRELKSKIRSVR